MEQFVVRKNVRNTSRSTRNLQWQFHKMRHFYSICLVRDTTMLQKLTNDAGKFGRLQTEKTSFASSSAFVFALHAKYTKTCLDLTILRTRRYLADTVDIRFSKGASSKRQQSKNLNIIRSYVSQKLDQKVIFLEMRASFTKY